MLTRFYLFRHGETDWNLNKKFQGHTNIPLNQNGRNQALSLQSKLEGLRPQVCISSDLDRAIETAKIALSSHTLPFLYSSDLRETHLGDVEGLSQDEITQKYGLELLQRFRSVLPEDLEMNFPNGESKAQHLQRIKTHLANFATLNSHVTDVAVSTHGGSLVRLVHSCENAPESPIVIPNCCLYEVHFHRDSQKWIFHKYHQ